MCVSIYRWLWPGGSTPLLPLSIRDPYDFTGGTFTPDTIWPWCMSRQSNLRVLAYGKSLHRRHNDLELKKFSLNFIWKFLHLMDYKLTIVGFVLFSFCGTSPCSTLDLLWSNTRLIPGTSNLRDKINKGMIRHQKIKKTHKEREGNKSIDKKSSRLQSTYETL